MDAFICNKCFAPTHRGKKPFCLTQCGHIFCHGCIQQAEKECPQCQQIDIFSVELQQPTLTKVENFFTPLNESLESLHRTCSFQNTQTSILLQRFIEIDKKYESVKSLYFNLTKNFKLMKEKYVKLKMENVEQRKKLMFYEMQSGTLHSLSETSTPANSDTHRNAKMRNTSNSSFLSCGTNALRSLNIKNERNMLEGFRIPYPQSVKSVNSHVTANRNSNYAFRP